MTEEFYVPSWFNPSKDSDGTIQSAPYPEGYDSTPPRAGLQKDRVYLCAYAPLATWARTKHPSVGVGHILSCEFPWVSTDRVTGMTALRLVGQDAALRDMRTRLGAGFEHLFPEVS